DMLVTALQPGQYQPRQSLSDDSLSELANSIREQGVLQPLIVRPISAANGITHEIVAGERRWRASQIVGLEFVPVVVRELDDQSALAVALIENLQREDLNAIEQAHSLMRLAKEFQLTHQQVADAVGRSRSSVSNLLRLLDLDDAVKDMLANGRLDMGHARALLPLRGEHQVKIAQKASSSGWSVRQVEKSVRSRLTEDAARKPAAPIDMQTRWLQEQLGKELGQKVTVRPRNDGTYKLDIAFASLDQLQFALGQVQDLIGQLQAAAGPRVRTAAK
ncbi:MAG: ParB/RepB/Spo0J family partition protein, partial [Woeseia sp.]